MIRLEMRQWYDMIKWSNYGGVASTTGQYVALLLLLNIFFQLHTVFWALYTTYTLNHFEFEWLQISHLRSFCSTELQAAVAHQLASVFSFPQFLCIILQFIWRSCTCHGWILAENSKCWGCFFTQKDGVRLSGWCQRCTLEKWLGLSPFGWIPSFTSWALDVSCSDCHVRSASQHNQLDPDLRGGGTPAAAAAAALLLLTHLETH